MDMNKLTHKSQEAVQAAQTRALRFGDQEVDGEHLLACLLEQPNGIFPKILDKMAVDTEPLKQALEADLQRRTRVSGSGIEHGKFFATPRFQTLLADA